jgi:hypothetical protein
MPTRLVNKAQSQTAASGFDKDNAIPRDNTRAANQSIIAFRSTNNDVAAVRALDLIDGTVSSAIFSFVEIANSPYKVAAFETATHQFSEDGTQMARSVLAGLDTLYDYSKGYADKRSLSSTLETALLEVIQTGALACELVMDKYRLPERINIVPYETLEWVSRGDGTKYPRQLSTTGDPIPLDIPNFFVSELHKQAAKAYATTMMSAALNSSYHFNEFIEDMRRAVRRQGHGRLNVKLISEQVRAAAPDEYKSDPVKMKAWMDAVQEQVVTALQGLNPEDALVFFDSAEVDMLKSEGEKADYVPLMNALSGQHATSLKTSPSILGLRLSGSQSLSNTESLVFLKVAKGIQRPIEEVMSRILTLAVRLYGVDVYVKFKFDPINLRPEDELEAFKTMQKDRIFSLLSEGFLTDDEAAYHLDTGPRAPGAPPLSGTGFMRTAKGIDATDASPNDDPQGRALQPDTPSKAGGESQ